MNRTAWQWMGRTVAVVAAVVMAAACAGDAPVGPDAHSATPASAVATVGSGPSVSLALADAAAGARNTELEVCQNLNAPAGSSLVRRVYAQGVQIYHWNGASWTFDGPSAVLTADAAGNGIVGTHYAGPTWESLSGGTVVGSVLDRCTPDPTAVPWLSLSAVAQGPGIFHRVTFIQRVNTVGGIAPAMAGSVIGEEARVPYTTEYLFYRTN